MSGKVKDVTPVGETDFKPEWTETEGTGPTILAFCCNWCSYAGADSAGVGRLVYPASARIVRVMCSGRLDPVWILEAFRRGIDGVFASG